MQANESQKKANTKAMANAIEYAFMKKTKMAPLNDSFSLEQTEPRLGEWYFFGPCQHCTRDIPLFSDRSEGKYGSAFAGEGYVRLKCIHCQQETKVHPPFRSAQWT